MFVSGDGQGAGEMDDKDAPGNFLSDACVHDLGRGHGFKPHPTAHFKCVRFAVRQLYFTKTMNEPVY